jgi:tRNA threonylcarbamoyladenosine biosynthesis protein TsaB
MKILALEFSTNQQSVAALNMDHDHREKSAGEAIESRQRSSRALRMVQAALDQAQLNRGDVEVVAVGTGPGSYSGIRSAIALAQGWQLARGIKLLGISSMQCLVITAAEQCLFGQFDFVIDAQRNEFYHARYDLSEKASNCLEPLRLLSASEVAAFQREGRSLVGPDAEKWFPAAHSLFPRALTLARMARDLHDFVPGEKLEPIYLRQPAFVKAPPSKSSALGL